MALEQAALNQAAHAVAAWSSKRRLFLSQSRPKKIVVLKESVLASPRMSKAASILLCLAVWISLSVPIRSSFACLNMDGARMEHPCCPSEDEPAEHPEWTSRCCELVHPAALTTHCAAPPSSSRFLVDAPAVVLLALVPLPVPAAVLPTPRLLHAGIPPDSGFRLLKTTVLRI